MSTISESQLNPAGHMALGTISSFGVNAVVHPISTLKNRDMAATPSVRPAVNSRFSIRGVPFRELYAGYLAISVAEAASFGTAFLTNDSYGSTAAGIISSPIVAGGEALTANRQVNNLPYSQILKTALRPAGMVMTVAREVPYNWAVLTLAPLLQQRMVQQWSRAIGKRRLSPYESLIINGVGGAVAGGLAGVATGPIDLIKTRVQTSSQPISIPQAIGTVYREGGLRAFKKGAGLRGLYIAVAGAGVNVFNNAVPNLLPPAFKM